MQPGHSAVVSLVMTDVFEAMQKSEDQSQDTLERFALDSINKHIHHTPDYDIKDRARLMDEAFSLVDSIIGVQTTGEQLIQYLNHLSQVTEYCSQLDTVAVPVYGAAFITLTQQMTGFDGDAKNSLSRRDFVRLSSTMYDLAQIHIRNIEKANAESSHITNN